MNNALIQYRYNCLPFLAVFYSVSTIVTLLSENKMDALNLYLTYNFLCSFSYNFRDVIAEVYGYKRAMMFLWSELGIRTIFITVLMLAFISPQADSNQYKYTAMFENCWYIFLINPIALLIAVKINIALFMRWRIALCGKYFIFRSIVSSGIGEVMFLFMIFANDVLNKNLVLYHIVPYFFWISLSRVIFTMLFSFPSLFFVKILKIMKGAGFSNLAINKDFNYK